MAASATTMSKFGPSGSLRRAKKALEHARAVMPRMINGFLFDIIDT